MLRAVIYSRCSTEEESQRDALAKQVAEAKESVAKNGWLLIDCYVESRSGTTTKGRKEYNRLYEDMAEDKFDIIVIKSQDRLMRNTKDWYLFVDRLTAQHKNLYLYMEQKFYSADDALITGIKAILAEDYSRELSKKINNAHKGRQQHNGNIILTSHAYGFKKLPDKSVVLVEEEAKVKERMYRLCADGLGARAIAAILKDEGILNRNGTVFTANAILRILRNPLNKGTVVMNKQHFDFDTKKVIRVPKEEQYVYENKVPRTVSDELWEKANEQIDNRILTRSKTEHSTRGRTPGKHPFSGKLVCGLCGKPYYRRTRRKYKDKSLIYEWKCKSYLDNGCGNVHLSEEILYKFLENVWKEIQDIDKENIKKYLLTLMEQVFKKTDIQPDIDVQVLLRDKIELQMNILIDKLLEGVIEDSLYQKKQRQLEKELQRIKAKIEELESQKHKENLPQERLKHIEQIITERNIMEESLLAVMLDEITQIIVYPSYFEMVYGCNKTNEKVRIEYGTLFDCRRRQKDALQEVVDYMRETPNITAREIAEKCGRTTSCIQQRIAKLRKEGRIQFVGKAGRGHWNVLEKSKKEEET